jgi:hypothetical protein
MLKKIMTLSLVFLSSDIFSMDSNQFQQEFEYPIQKTFVKDFDMPYQINPETEAFYFDLGFVAPLKESINQFYVALYDKADNEQDLNLSTQILKKMEHFCNNSNDFLGSEFILVTSSGLTKLERNESKNCVFFEDETLVEDGFGATFFKGEDRELNFIVVVPQEVYSHFDHAYNIENNGNFFRCLEDSIAAVLGNLAVVELLQKKSSFSAILSIIGGVKNQK